MIEVRSAKPDEFSSILNMLDATFFSEDNPAEQRNFMQLLPKLYKEQYAPWNNNYCVFEHGRPVAAVGMYVNELHIAGHTLKLGGIGNVGVASDCRGKGYMKLAMDAAMQAMREQGCHLAELSGDRHRYRYWGFDQGGTYVDAQFSMINVKHSFGKAELAAGWTTKPLALQDIAPVQALIEAEPLHLKHRSAALHDVLSSWREQPWALWYDGKLAGRFNLSWDNKQALQLQLAAWVDSLEQPLRAILALLPADASVAVRIPLWRPDLLTLAAPVAESMNLHSAGQYNVLNWQACLAALLDLQAQCKTLLDGEFTVNIQGYAGEECLRIAVQNGRPNVSVYHGKPQKSMSHLDAASYFLGLVCPARTCPISQNWFPLPMWLWSYDTV